MKSTSCLPPMSSSQSTEPCEVNNNEGDDANEHIGGFKAPRPHGKARVWKFKKATKYPSTSTAFSSFAATSRQRRGGVRIRSRRSANFAYRGGGGGDDDSVQDLALPLGMSLAATIAQVMDRKNILGEQLPVDHLSMICTSAVKESITYIYGNRFDSFIRNFAISFGSTLKALRSINETSLYEQGSTECFSSLSNDIIEEPIQEIPQSLSDAGGFEDNLPSNSTNNQLIIHGGINQHLASLSQGVASSVYNQSILSTFEQSVREQSRSNDLKAVEIGLSLKRLQLKESQLALNSYANVLEKIKISMGISKASFKEEKLRNQMLDARHAELLKSCIDLLVAGLILMCCFLVYGAFTFSYQRIMEATSSCTITPKETKSWWIPKPVASFSSGWLMLRCHAVALTRMSFGLLMILAVAYSLFQRSAVSASTMPVTFLLLLLGVACGLAGKLCVDTLGGDGYCWLLYWEAFCILHFFANVFPSTLYRLLYGPVSVSERAEMAKLPYLIRRCTFYGVMVLIFPLSAGMLPFASYHVWKEHFLQDLSLWS